jgi:alpha-L-fucosidase
MDSIAAMARTHQPGLIIVDRWVSGRYENYLTPEQSIPGKVIEVPWESCITMAGGWSYNRNHQYKPAVKLIHMLVEIVAKGGNFLLNIGPSPSGEWAPEVYDRLEEIGGWMKVNGEAIYATRPFPPHRDGNVFFTKKMDSEAVYAICLAGEKDEIPPGVIRASGFCPPDQARCRLLGWEGEVKWQAEQDGFRVDLSQRIREKIFVKHAWVLKFFW